MSDFNYSYFNRPFTAKDISAGAGTSYAWAVTPVDAAGNVIGSAATPDNVTTQLGRASGTTPVSGTFVAAGSSTAFTPQVGRDINIQLLQTVAWVGVSVRIDISFDAGATWNALTLFGNATSYVFTTPITELGLLNVSETGVIVRLTCTALTSGTVTYRISH